MKIRLLGISASPRHANTEIMVKEALRAAERLGDVETELISLTGKNIGPCTACYRCYTGARKDRFCVAYGAKDVLQPIYESMLRADGIIVGTAVYWGNVTSPLKALFDRTMPFCHYSSTPCKGALAHKVGAGLAMSYDIHGNNEIAIQAIHAWMLTQDMIVVSSGPQRPTVCYIGGACHQWPNSALDSIKVKPDGLGLRSCRGVGMKVAEVARIIKSGLKDLKHEDPYQTWLREPTPKGVV